MRLLMLYIISQEGIHDVDRNRLLQQANISNEDSQTITNLGYLNVRLVPSDKKEDRGPYGYYNKKIKNKKNKKSDAMNYDLSRYVPMVKYLMEDQVNDKVDNTWFPYLNEAKKKVTNAIKLDTVVGSAKYPNSLRTTRANWQPRKTKASSPMDNLPIDSSSEYRRNGPIVLLFVLGGMTYSEVRSCYDIMNEYKRDVIIGTLSVAYIIGSSHIITPVQFIDQLRDLHTGAPKLPSLPSTIKEDPNRSGFLDPKKGFGVFKKK